MIKFTHKGNFELTTKFFTKMANAEYLKRLGKFGREGVNALSSATPVDSSLTADSWSYEVTEKNGYFAINWYNSNRVDDVPIAIILQYGHGTNNGGYVQGRDYINPAIQPVFDKIVDKAWREVRKA